MYNFKNPVFTKLYRYYCAKLLNKLGIVAFWFLYVLVLLIFTRKSAASWFEKADSGLAKLAVFGFFSLGQLGFLWVTINSLIAYLVGRDSGGGQLTSGQLFRMPGIHKEEDVKVLLFAPKADRETVIFAKFAAAFTYFMAINFILCSVLAVFFLAVTNLGVLAVLSFLLLNGLFFGLVNFCGIVPFIFYQQEGGSWLVYFFIFGFIITLYLVGYLLREIILQYPLVFMLLSIPLLVLTGYFFYTLYRKKFLAQDLG